MALELGMPLPLPVSVALLPAADVPVGVSSGLSRVLDDWDNVGSWVLSRFWTVRNKRNASWASFSGATSVLEIGRVWVRFGERRLE